MTTKSFDPSKIKHCFTVAEVNRLIARMSDLAGETLVYDLETTCLNEWLPYSRVSMATFTFGEDENYCVPLSHPDSPFRGYWKSVLRTLATAMLQNRWVGQNLPFDVRWVFATTGVDLTDCIETDTMLGSHLLDDLSTTSLKPRAAKVFDIPQWDDFDFKVIEKEQEKDPKIHLIRTPRLSERVPYMQLATYATADTYWTWRLLKYQEQQLKLDPHVRSSMESEQDLSNDDLEVLRMGRYKQAIGDLAVSSLSKMSIHGMKANRPWCEARLQENEVRIQELAKELVGWPEVEPPAGDWSFNPNSLWFKEWADRMVRFGYLREVGITDKGAVSWDEACLKRNVRLGMTAAAILMDLRTRTTENQFLRVWLQTSEIDGRIHANFNFARTRTGRLSSSDPNLQQVSRVMKEGFEAEFGYNLVTADYSMVELRIAAHLGKIKPIQKALWDGIDLHKLTASQVAGVMLDMVTKDMRQNAKAVNFGFLFGMGAPKFVSYAEDTYEAFFTHEEAELARRAFYATWEGLHEWHEERRQEVRTTGQVVCPLGRIRRLPDGLSRNKYWRGQAERQAINTPVQSTASDMMLVAVNEMCRRGWKTVAIVHDAMICEVEEARTEECAREMKNVMELYVPDYLKRKLGFELSVPLVADTSYGRSWGAQRDLVIAA